MVWRGSSASRLSIKKPTPLGVGHSKRGEAIISNQQGALLLRPVQYTTISDGLKYLL